MRRTKTFRTDLQCRECGTEASIQRRKSLRKEPEHVKHYYCYKCRDTTAHIELGNNEHYGWREAVFAHE